MGIILRQNKGSELTFKEVDGNFQSLIYSSSLDPIGPVIKLFHPSSSLTQSIDLSHVTFVSSSAVFVTGSNVFGNTCHDHQSFTGSIEAWGCNSHYIGGAYVGINKKDPHYNLDVSGSARISDNLIVSASTGDPFIISMDNGNGPNEKFKINSEGVIVIGEVIDTPTPISGGLIYSASAFYLAES